MQLICWCWKVELGCSAWEKSACANNCTFLLAGKLILGLWVMLAFTSDSLNAQHNLSHCARVCSTVWHAFCHSQGLAMQWGVSDLVLFSKQLRIVPFTITDRSRSVGMWWAKFIDKSYLMFTCIHLTIATGKQYYSIYFKTFLYLFSVAFNHADILFGMKLFMSSDSKLCFYGSNINSKINVFNVKIIFYMCIYSST